MSDQHCDHLSVLLSELLAHLEHGSRGPFTGWRPTAPERIVGLGRLRPRSTRFGIHRRLGGEGAIRMPYDHRAVHGVDAGQYWLGMLDEHGVQFLVLNRHSDGELLRLARAHPGWTVDSEDGETMILIRTNPAGRSGQSGPVPSENVPVGGRWTPR